MNWTIALVCWLMMWPGSPAAGQGAMLVDDFEGYTTGKHPSRWQFFTSKEDFKPLGAFMEDDERFYIVAEAGNKFVRAYTKGEAQRITLGNEEHGLGWSLATHPRLQWKWRALQLPVGAREDKVNDSGGAVYVSFGEKDWLGRPYSLKYVYSTTMPVGTVVSSGNVKVVVVSSGTEGFGKWLTVERDVAADYRRLFDRQPPDAPFSITLWSDSDNTKSVGEVDFDNIRLLPRK